MMKKKLFSILVLVFLLLSIPTSVQAGSTYYVTKAGNDTTGNGSVGTPWLTIQKCLNTVAAGDTCNIGTGTYSEALTIVTTGSAANRITVQSYNGDVTVSSGASRTLVTSGYKGFYTFDGIDLKTTGSPADITDASVHFSYNFWGDGPTAERGNDGFILKNCYVEGAVYFYGSDNIVENCELNGLDTWQFAIMERSEPSERNIFRNNIMHDYTRRGGWTLQMPDDSLWEGNIIYNTGWLGIDCDGAGLPVDQCDVKNNLIYNVGGAPDVEADAGIIMENAFNSVVEGNVIHDANHGIAVINYGDDLSDDEYRDNDNNSSFTDNLIYNVSNGLMCWGSPGGIFTNNTINHTTQNPGYYGAIALSDYGGYSCRNWTINNNIVTESTTYAIWVVSPAGGMGTLTMDYNLFDLGAGDAKFRWRDIGGATNTYTLSGWQSAKSLETHSVLGNASTLAVLERTFTYSKFFWLVRGVLMGIYF